MPTKPQPFNLLPGRRVGNAYVVEDLLGRGTEGEVYRVRDTTTGIRRAAKFFYADPQASRKLIARHAVKLERLRRCPIVLQYLHREQVTVRRRPTVVLVSELCAGVPLQTWIDQQRGRRAHPFIALTILHRLVVGLEAVHELGEYHSDVHTENVLIEPHGVDFSLQLIDFYDWGRPTKAKRQEDVVQCVAVLADLLGGRDRYATFPPEVKTICAGFRRGRLLDRFPTIAALRHHLETFSA